MRNRLKKNSGHNEEKCKELNIALKGLSKAFQVFEQDVQIVRDKD